MLAVDIIDIEFFENDLSYFFPYLLLSYHKEYASFVINGPLFIARAEHHSKLPHNSIFFLFVEFDFLEQSSQVFLNRL